ncbi:MAG: hypothetical protein AB1698_11365 [Pseudomonadota bacterium]
MSFFLALVVPGMVLCILAAIDLIRAGGLRDSLQHAADLGVREVVRGLPEATTQARIRANLQDAGLGAEAWDELSIVIDTSGEETASVGLEVPFTGFLPLRSGTRVSAQASARFFCAPPATRWVPVSEACPEGEAGMIAYDAEEAGYCASPTAAPTWRATGTRQNVVSTCSAS